jgi:outer membrane protein with beta-barrel domain
MRRAFLAFALFLLPSAAFAQLGRFELTPVGGYRLDGDFDARSSDVFDPDLNVTVDASGVFGLLLDIPLSPNWAIELLANRQQTEFVVDRGLLTPSTELGDVDLTVIQAGILLQWGEGQAVPFVTAAAGLTRIEPKFNELASDDRFSASVGGGVKVFFSENLGLRLEGRGYWTDLDTGFDDRFDRYDSGDGLFQGEGSVGLIIAF